MIYDGRIIKTALISAGFSLVVRVAEVSIEVHVQLIEISVIIEICYNGIAHEFCLGKSLGNSYRLIYKPKEMLLVKPIMKSLFE